MKANNVKGLWGMLEDLPVAELDQLLEEELLKEKPDPAAVKLILTVLEQRESEPPKVRSMQSAAARQKYQERMEALFPPEPKRSWTPLLRAASVVLILGLLVAVVPQRAEAETFWEMLQRWSNTVIEFFNREDSFREKEYVFVTDNPGLQQIYDAVVELGVTEPVVPMWLPGDCEITEFVEKSTPMLSGVFASFSNGTSQIVYELDIYGGEPAHQYYKDDTHYESYELEGITFNIARNNERWSAIWTKDNIECHITLDCQEETLRRILNSIYVMEDNE